MKIVFVRREDYWIFPLSFIGVISISTFLYAGVMWLRLTSGLVGFATFYFAMYIVRKNYSRRLAARYMLICLVASVITAYLAYILTN